MTAKPRKQRPIRRAILTRLGGLFAGSQRNPSRLFLLFNHAVVGGADVVHARIAQSVAEVSPWIYLTLPTWPQPFAVNFPASARLEFVGRRCTGPARRFFHIGRLAALINAHERPTVLGGNSRFFYELTALLRPHVRCIDLVHALASVEHFSLPYAPRLDARVFINAGVRDDVAAIYDQAGLEPALKQRMRVIENCVDLPPPPPPKPEGPLRVLYVGRGAPEKRVHLVGRVASACADAGIAAEFTLVGDVNELLDPADRQYCRFTGLLDNPALIHEHYAAAHVLLLTSRSEGFPVVVMEAMAHGVVPVCSNVGGMPAHVLPGETGELLPAEEAALVPAAVEALRKLAADRGRLAAMAAAARARAEQHFTPERFVGRWRELLLGEGAP